MESQVSPAEELPALYRMVLDGVAVLETLGERREANRVRAEAIRIYSTSWDDGGRRRLVALVRHLERIASGEDAARTDRPRRWLAQRWLEAR
jgi:hypothetical protein